MIKTLTNLPQENAPIIGKDDFDERLSELLDNEWKLIHYNSFGDYERVPTGVDGATMLTRHITKIAVLQK